jgi:dTDP-4-dehydrorhamnose 3,5-epimerase
MEFERLPIEGAWIVSSGIHCDERGSFREWFKADEILKATGEDFLIGQSNISISQAGVIRGVHYSLAPQGQAKWVTCVVGSIWDVVVDIRPSSPTFKKWVGIDLDGKSGKMILISKGLGHAFISLEDNSIVSYSLTSPYSPSDEYEINPFDPDLQIQWPHLKCIISPKDENAPSIASRLAEGNLPGVN